MSNERIDLTQFEGMTTPWDFGKKYPHIESAKVAVELIAELKRCYEETDELLETIGSWGYVMCPRSTEWFEWDYGCQSEKCASHDDDCRELVEASQ